MSTQTANNRRRRRMRGHGRGPLQSGFPQYLVDTTVATSDGSQIVPTDFGNSAVSSVPPLTPPRFLNKQVFWARAIIDSATTLSAVGETQTANTFTLSQLPNSSSYTTIFDQYSIIMVVAKIRGGENVTTIATGLTPRFYVALDFDDNTALSTSSLKEYATCTEHRMCDSVTRVLYPRVAIAAYSGAFTSFANQRTWIDCASPNVVHYGLKWSAEADSRASVGEILVRYEVYYAFRNRH